MNAVAAGPRGVRDYALVTAAYWVFTLTDGALRMLVLLHLHQLGYAPLAIVSLFLFYEFFGVVTNLLGGWLGSRFGLKSTLVSGLLLQIAACTLLAAAVPSVAVVLVAQALSGVAKDLTKMSSKSYVRMVVPEGDRRGLLKWVALLTGSKNALKGAGFFVGGVLLAAFGFAGACGGMAAALAATFAGSVLMLPGRTGRGGKRLSLRALVDVDRRLRWLAAARLLLFGARDVWFVLAVPVYLAAELGWSHAEVGGFLALWIIGYGAVQATTPAWLGGAHRQVTATVLAGWTGGLFLPLAGILLALQQGVAPGVALVVGLAAFGVLFAVASAQHSYLVVAYAERDRVARDVGFYYMANAAGRLLGTVASGFVFQAAGQGTPGLAACVTTAAGLVVGSALLCVPLRKAERSGAASAG